MLNIFVRKKSKSIKQKNIEHNVWVSEKERSKPLPDVEEIAMHARRLPRLNSDPYRVSYNYLLSLI